MDTAATVTRFVIDELLAGEDVGGLDPDYDLVANGVIDSLGVIQLVGWLNDAFGISVEDVDMTDFESINAICALVANAPHLTR
jgi:acyl carrier protein